MANINLVLNFTMELQQEDNWCWAATGKSVSHFYSDHCTWRQCTIAGKELNRSCCSNHAPCDRPWRLDKTLKRTKNFRYQQSDVIAWDQIKQEIEADLIVCAFIKWNGGGGHFVAIKGVVKVGSSKRVWIDDPIYGQSLRTYIQFRDDYRRLGSWTWTFFTKKHICSSPN